MAFIYAWRPARCGPDQAAERFASVTDRHRAVLERFGGAPVGCRRECLNRIWVAGLTFENGVSGLIPWAASEAGTVVQGGVCEDWLDLSSERIVAAAFASVRHDDGGVLRNLAGRFSFLVAVRDGDGVGIFTGAHSYAVLWYAEGPNGVAIGSRALPVLGLVGRPARIDPLAAGIFTAYDYALTRRALFEDVQRLGPRSRFVLPRSGEPRVREYISFGDVLLRAGQEAPAPDDFEAVTGHMAGRLRRQVEASRRPVLLLTGGRDSRGLALLARHALGTIDTVTTGPADHEDMVLAGRLAAHLGLPWKPYVFDRISLLEDEGLAGRCMEWLAASEGMETLRQSLAQVPWFCGERVSPFDRAQYLHGSGGEIMRGGLGAYLYTVDTVPDPGILRASLVRRAEGYLRFADSIRACAMAEVDALWDLARGLGLQATRLSPLLYIERRCLHWAEDMFSAHTPLGWTWTPYMDRIWTGWMMNCSLTPTHKNVHVDAWMRFLAGTDIPVGHTGGRPADHRAARGRLKRGLRYVDATLMRRLSSAWSPAARRNRLRDRWWNAVLFRRDGFWTRIADPDGVRKLARRNPDAKPLWVLATLELLDQALRRQTGEV